MPERVLKEGRVLKLGFGQFSDLSLKCCIILTNSLSLQLQRANNLFQLGTVTGQLQFSSLFLGNQRFFIADLVIVPLKTGPQLY